MWYFVQMGWVGMSRSVDVHLVQHKQRTHLSAHATYAFAWKYQWARLACAGAEPDLHAQCAAIRREDKASVSGALVVQRRR